MLSITLLVVATSLAAPAPAFPHKQWLQDRRLQFTVDGETHDLVLRKDGIYLDNWNGKLSDLQPTGCRGCLSDRECMRGDYGRWTFSNGRVIVGWHYHLHIHSNSTRDELKATYMPVADAYDHVQPKDSWRPTTIRTSENPYN